MLLQLSCKQHSSFSVQDSVYLQEDAAWVPQSTKCDQMCLKDSQCLIHVQTVEVHLTMSLRISGSPVMDALSWPQTLGIVKAAGSEKPDLPPVEQIAIGAIKCSLICSEAGLNRKLLMLSALVHQLTCQLSLPCRSRESSIMSDARRKVLSHITTTMTGLQYPGEPCGQTFSQYCASPLPELGLIVSIHLRVPYGNPPPRTS